MAVERYELMVRNLQEVVGEDELRNQLSSSDASSRDSLTLYWGTATTGRPHVAYFVPIIKLADFLRAGFKVIVLLADLHGYLDNMKAPWPLLRLRTRYYEAVIKGMLESISVPSDRLTFIRGADFELTEAYSADLYRLLAVTTVHDARKAGAEVVKQVANPLVSGLLYPLLQANDEVHLHVRAQFGGIDQRKIFMLAEKYLPHIGHKKRIHLMNPMVPGLTGGKMSASEIDSKIDLLDSSDTVERKLAGAVCDPGQSAEQGNGVLAFLKYVVFPLTNQSAGLSIPGHPEVYHSFADLESHYLVGQVSGDALKQAVSQCLNNRLDTIRAQFAGDPQLTALVQQAYPKSEADLVALSSELEDVSVTPAHSGHHSSNSVRLSDRLDDVLQQMRPLRDQEALIKVLQSEFSGYQEGLLTSRLSGNEGHLRVLWSVTPIGLPHIGYSLPMRSLAKLSCIDGVHITVLVNNVAAHLRGVIPWDLVVPRGEFYRTILTGLFKAQGGRADQMMCVLGSEFQLGGDYMLDFYRLVSLVPESDCMAAVADCCPSGAVSPGDDFEEVTVVGTPAGELKTTANSAQLPGPGRFVLGQLLLPCLDLVNSLYLGADIRLARASTTQWRQAFEQRMIGKFLPSSHTPLVCLSHMLFPSLLTCSDDPPAVQPMQPCHPSACAASASTVVNGQSLLSCEEACLPLVDLPSAAAGPGGILPGVKRRLKRAFCRPEVVDVNPVLDVYRHILLPELTESDSLTIPRSEKNGGPLCVTSSSPSLESRWQALRTLFAEGILHPGDLKPAVDSGLCSAPGSLAHRLTAQLPSWADIVRQMELAYPATVKRGKAKVKASGGDAAAVVCNGTKPPPASVDHKKDADDLDPNRLDIRVGRIVSVNLHPNADTLFVEDVDFGPELGTRTVCSGLVGRVPRERLENLVGAFIVNLKPVCMRGVNSQAMLLCATHQGDDATTTVQPIHVPNSLSPGSRLTFHSPAGVSRQPDTLIGPKGKLWDRLASDLAVSLGADRCVTWRDWRLGTESCDQWITGPMELPGGSAVR